MPTRSIFRDLILLILMNLCIHVPFVNKAFHLDDVQYLAIARNVFENPLFPLDLPYVFEGQRVSLWGHTHPPLNSYFLAGALWVANAPPSEVPLHSLYLLFPLAATVSFYFLARRFAVPPILSTALLVSVPAIIVSAQTLMTDVPLLAFWLCATTLFIYGVDRRDNRLTRLTLLPLTAAVFTSYQGLALLPLLLLYAFLHGQLRARLTVIVSLPVILLASWQLLGYAYRGSFYATTLFDYLQQLGVLLPSTKVSVAISTLTYLGGTILLFPFLFVAFGRTSKVLAFAALVVAVLVAAQRLPNYGTLQRALFASCFAGGLLTTAWVLRFLFGQAAQRRENADGIFLSLWFLGVISYCILLFFSGSARYLLPASPPLLILLVKTAQSRWSPTALGWRGFWMVLLACQLALGLAAAHADYEFANIGRQAARDFQQRHLISGEAFFFSGEWGFRYYLSELGGQIMTADSTAPLGTLVIKSRLSLSKSFDNEFDRSLEVVEKRTYAVSSPLRLLDYGTHAGWWSDGWGVLPFWFSTQPLDEVTVYRVSKHR